MWLLFFLTGCAEPPACVLPAGSGGGTDSGVGTSSENPAWLSPGPLVPCPSPVAAPSYVDRATEWGLVDTADADTEHLDGGGAAVADFDGDGAADLVLASRDRLPLYLRWNGSTLEGQSLQGGTFSTSTSAMPVDGDGDGDFDLTITASTEILWYWNEAGDLRLDRGAIAGLPLEGMPGAAPGDADLDGDVDLLLAIYQSSDTSRRDRLLKNDGTGVFSVTEPFSGGGGGHPFRPSGWTWRMTGRATPTLSMTVAPPWAGMVSSRTPPAPSPTRESAAAVRRW